MTNLLSNPMKWFFFSLSVYVCEATNDSNYPPPCPQKIWCYSDLLKYNALYQLDDEFEIPFLRKRLVNSSDVVLAEYDELVKSNRGEPPSKDQLREFINTYLEDRAELIDFLPDEYKNNTALMQRVTSSDYRHFLADLQQIWRTLLRKVAPDVTENEDRYTLISIPYGFVVAGGQFNELYYWDTYWIIRGLYLSDLPETAKGIIENFLYLVRKFGFIPNGTRVYYLNRSQPPLLPSMIQTHQTYTGDTEFIFENLETITEEFEWWRQNRQVKFVKDGKTYAMFHYDVRAGDPRPESYLADYDLGIQIKSEDERNAFYANIKSATESGWDFSSRWFDKYYANANGSLLDTKPSILIQVDLNSFLQKNARLISKWWFAANDAEKGKIYKKVADDLFQSIQEVLYREDEGVWFDWDLENEIHREGFYVSNFTPLFTLSYDTSDNKNIANKVIEYLQRNGILDSEDCPIYIATPTSFVNSTQQWDFPNAWAPLQAILIDGLGKTGSSRARKIALQLANNFVYTTRVGLNSTGFMFEKYDAIEIGTTGGGGEYAPQTGFGWTNGYVIQLLGRYYDLLSPDAAKTCSS
nr:PREDICTED: trehalase-like [Bemisia tabaci]